MAEFVWRQSSVRRTVVMGPVNIISNVPCVETIRRLTGVTKPSVRTSDRQTDREILASAAWGWRNEWRAYHRLRANDPTGAVDDIQSNQCKSCAVAWMVKNNRRDCGPCDPRKPRPWPNKFVFFRFWAESEESWARFRGLWKRFGSPRVVCVSVCVAGALWLNASTVRVGFRFRYHWGSTIIIVLSCPVLLIGLSQWFLPITASLYCRQECGSVHRKAYQRWVLDLENISLFAKPLSAIPAIA